MVEKLDAETIEKRQRVTVSDVWGEIWAYRILGFLLLPVGGILGGVLFVFSWGRCNPVKKGVESVFWWFAYYDREKCRRLLEQRKERAAYPYWWE